MPACALAQSAWRGAPSQLVRPATRGRRGPAERREFEGDAAIPTRNINPSLAVCGNPRLFSPPRLWDVSHTHLGTNAVAYSSSDMMYLEVHCWWFTARITAAALEPPADQRGDLTCPSAAHVTTVASLECGIARACGTDSAFLERHRQQTACARGLRRKCNTVGRGPGESPGMSFGAPGKQPKP